MPKPRPYEKKDEYISRCIGVLINEGKPKDQAIAICESMWKNKGLSAYEKIMKQYKNKKNE